MTTAPGGATHTAPLVAGARPIPGRTAIEDSAGCEHGPAAAGADGDGDGAGIGIVPAIAARTLKASSGNAPASAMRVPPFANTRAGRPHDITSRLAHELSTVARAHVR